MNSAYKEYSRLAYKKAILASLQRFLLEHLPSETVGPIRTLDCEEVMVSDRLVPEEAIHDVLDELREEEETLKVSLATFEFRKKGTKKDVRGKSEEPESPSQDSEEDDA